jgi:hypothetical protein
MELLEASFINSVWASSFVDLHFLPIIIEVYFSISSLSAKVVLGDVIRNLNPRSMVMLNLFETGRRR